MLVDEGYDLRVTVKLKDENLIFLYAQKGQHSLKDFIQTLLVSGSLEK